MRYNITGKLALIAPALLLVGCGSTPEHTNTLLFGTTTKFALDVSVNPAGGTPDFTVGYKRHEGVWMPLLANKKTGDATEPATCSNCEFVGKAKPGEKEDTYSVLASFGASFGGGAEANTPGEGDSPKASAKAQGGLAQFFATGIAARNLATTGGARLVSVQSADAETTAMAVENANAAKAKADEAEQKLKAVLGEKSYKEITEKGLAATNILKAKNGVIVASIIDGQGKLVKTKWDSLVDSTDLDATEKTNLKSFSSLGHVVAYLSGKAASEKSDEINALHSKL
jgi:hypothetical protein